MRSLLRKAPDRSDPAELKAAIGVVDSRLAALAAAAAQDEERLALLAVGAAAGGKMEQAELARLKLRVAERTSESDDLERARRRLAADLAAAEVGAAGEVSAAAWQKIEGKLAKRRACAAELERKLEEAGELWRRYDELGQSLYAAVPSAARGTDYAYLQPPARGTSAGDYRLAQALAAAGLGLAWGTHLPSAHDLSAWSGLAAEAEDLGRRLLALR